MLDRLGEGMLGIGGMVDTYILRGVKLTFRRENEESRVEDFDRIYVLKHAFWDERIMRIPSAAVVIVAMGVSKYDFLGVFICFASFSSVASFRSLFLRE